MDIGKIQTVDISQELSSSYLDYAMSVIVARALPDIRDGLKPVHRRILYAMWVNGFRYESASRKCAAIVGEVMKSYHPHGDSPIYDALVRLAQDFAIRYPLIFGQGNFGSVDGDPPAAMRYTEAKLSKISALMLEDIEKDTVDMSENFDATTKEPIFLPALLPNLLLMGSEGIAVGMATKIPPHNLGEVVDAIVDTVKSGKPIVDAAAHEADTEYFITKISAIAAGDEKNLTEEDLVKTSVSFDTEATTEQLVKHIPGPDFPTGGAIYDAASLVDMYTTGRGKIVVRGIAEIKEGSKGRSIIEVSELPYQVNKAVFVAHIAELVRDKKITGIATLRDESDKDGLSVIIELKRDSKPKSVLNNLFKHTKLQTTFPANFVALVDGTPHTVNLKQILVEYVKHRQRVIVRRTLFELTAAKRRSHILEGLKIALDNLDAVIKTIRASKTQDEAKTNLIAQFGFSGIQATAILDMQLRRLAALERQKIEDEYNELKKLIDALIIILKNPQKVLDIIVDEVTELKKTHGDHRRTKIYKQKVGEFAEEDLVAKEDTLITVTKTGYIKRVPRNTYRQQHRGGKGVLGMTTKDEDEIEHLLSATTHDTILFFTDRGRVFGAKVWDIPESSRQAKGQALVNIINLDQGELIQSIVPMTENGATHLLMATEKGVVKKTAIADFANLRANGLIAMKLAIGDSLITVKPTRGADLVMLVTQNGLSITFPEKEVRAMGRATSGMRGIKLSAGDKVIGLEVFPENEEKPADGRKKFFRELLTISAYGMGKRSHVSEFPVQKRGGKGVKAGVVTTKTGPLAGAIMVTQEVDQVVITSKYGVVIKLPVKNVPELGRATQGVILMRFTDETDSVAALATLEKGSDNEEE